MGRIPPFPGDDIPDIVALRRKAFRHSERPVRKLHRRVHALFEPSAVRGERPRDPVRLYHIKPESEIIGRSWMR